MAEAGRKIHFQGVLEHKQSGNREKYVSLYVCLVGRQIVIYDDFQKQKLLGTLTLDIGSKVKSRDKNGHRIELTTKDFEKGVPVPRRNVFRSESRSDRDIWYAYIHALTKGQVPSNLKIPPVIMIKIQEALQDCIRPAKPNPNGQQRGPGGHNRDRRPSAPNILQVYEPRPDYNDAYDHEWAARHQPPAPPLTPTGHHPSQNYQAFLAPVHESVHEGKFPRPRRTSEAPDCGAGARGLDKTDYDPVWRTPAVQPPIPQDQKRFARNSTSSAESEASGGKGSMRSDGSDEQPGVYKTHKFYTNHKMNLNKIPSWFFDNCTREQSELILTMGKNYGNVMMRESTTYRDNGSYVIDIRQETSRGCIMKHIEVTQGNGFEVMVENAKNESFSCLTEVMSYMLSCLGPDCRTMSTNNKTLIGIKEPDYDTVVHVEGKPTLRASTRHSAEELQTPPPIPHWRETGYNTDDSDSDTDYTPMDDQTKIYEEVDDYLQMDPSNYVAPEQAHPSQLQTLSISEPGAT